MEKFKAREGSAAAQAAKFMEKRGRKMEASGGIEVGAGVGGGNLS